MADLDVLKHAKVLWNYHVMGEKQQQADFILVLGSHDTRAAEHAVNLFNSGFAPLIVCSGGFGKVTRESWKEPEGLYFRRILKERGIPDGIILAECEATNTGDNFRFTKNLLLERGISVSSGIIVTKPYMARRAFATGSLQWPEIEWHVSCSPITFEDYPNEEVSQAKMINLMVGDLQRIAVYPTKGFQILQDIPPEVWTSYRALVSAGYVDFVLPNELGA